MSAAKNAAQDTGVIVFVSPQSTLQTHITERVLPQSLGGEKTGLGDETSKLAAKR